MINVTLKPSFENYHSNSYFLRILGLESDECMFLNLFELAISIPLIKKEIKNELWHGYTPIHFQEQINRNFWLKNISAISDALLEANCISFYIQTKDFIKSLSESNDNLFDISRFRTNYFFDLNRSEEDAISEHKRDSRSRLRKVLRSKYEVITNSLNYNDFHHYYAANAERLNFSDKYFLDLKTIKNIANMITLIEIKSENGTFLASGIFAESENEVDYLYGSDSFERKDSIRLLVHEASNFYKSKGFKKLFLGGGISENDNLAQFKERMGTTEAKCCAIMGITSKTKINQALNISIDRSVFDGYFPNFIKF